MFILALNVYEKHWKQTKAFFFFSLCLSLLKMTEVWFESTILKIFLEKKLGQGAPISLLAPGTRHPPLTSPPLTWLEIAFQVPTCSNLNQITCTTKWEKFQSFTNKILIYKWFINEDHDLIDQFQSIGWKIVEAL